MYGHSCSPIIFTYNGLFKILIRQFYNQYHLNLVSVGYFLVQVEIFLVFGMINSFLMKRGYFEYYHTILYYTEYYIEYYDIRFWISFQQVSCDTVLARKEVHQIEFSTQSPSERGHKCALFLLCQCEGSVFPWDLCWHLSNRGRRGRSASYSFTLHLH